MDKKPFMIIVLSLAIVLSSITVIRQIPVKLQATSQGEIEWQHQPKQVHDFNLESNTGTFSNINLQNRWTIIVFGYASCPDICPTSLFELSQLAQEIEHLNDAANIQFVFVSIDPNRDSLHDVTRYVSYFHPAFIGVTGNKNELIKLSQSIGIRFSVSEFAENYTVAHSMYFSIIAPDGRLHGRFQPNFDVEKLANELTSML